MYEHNFRVCFCFWRRFWTKKPDPPEDVKNMFDEYSENGTMNIEQLKRFLEEIQGEKSDMRAQTIFKNLKHPNTFQNRGLCLEDFFQYLLGDLNLALLPPHQVISLSSLYFSEHHSETKLKGFAWEFVFKKFFIFKSRLNLFHSFNFVSIGFKIFNLIHIV